MIARRVFLIIEIVLLFTVLILALLWARNPQDNYEPYITIISGVLIILLDTIRRNLKNTEVQVNQPLKQVRKKSPKITQSDQEAKYNVTVGNHARQVAIGENIIQSD